jgi:hypothetical protein
VQQGRRKYACLHCREVKQFIRLNFYRRQGCQANRNAAGVPIREKMYPNLLTDSIVKDLLAGVDPVRFINEYNDGWIAVSDDERLGNDVVTEVRDEAPAPTPGGTPAAAAPHAPAPTSAPVLAPTPAPAATPIPMPTPAVQPVPRSTRETQPPPRTGTQSVSTKSHGRPL